MDKFNEYVNVNVRPECPVEIEEDWVHNTFTVCDDNILLAPLFLRTGDLESFRLSSCMIGSISVSIEVNKFETRGHKCTCTGH